jgi:hypothetical protein
LSHGLWDNFKLRAEEGIELPHGKEAGAGKALHARVAGLQVQRHLLHHRGAPSALALPGIQLTTNVPVQAQQLGIDRKYGPRLSCLDALLDGGQCLAVSVWWVMLLMSGFHLCGFGKAQQKIAVILILPLEVV